MNTCNVESTSAVSDNEESQLNATRLAGVITLINGASLLWTLSEERRRVRLPVSSRASRRGLISMAMMIPIHHDILNLVVDLVLNIVYNLIALVHHENVQICEHVGIDRLH